MKTPVCEPTCARDGTCSVCEGPHVLHNMSVPSTSQITVARALLPGLRFRVRLHEQLHRLTSEVREPLAKHGWRGAWKLLEEAGDAPKRAYRAKRRQDVLERHLELARRAAGVPDRLGLFVLEHTGLDLGTLLSPAAALAVLARRSGPLYLPTRRLDPSLVDPMSFVLFFPEESR